MSLKITNYLVLDNDINMRNLLVSKTYYEYTEEGNVFYPIKGVIPVIVKGKGCIGTALIKSIYIKEETTTIGFEFTPVNNTTAKVMYAMYMNNSSMMNVTDNDVYNHDVSIPGAINTPTVNLANTIGKDNIMNDVFRTISGSGKSGKKKKFYDDDDF